MHGLLVVALCCSSDFLVDVLTFVGERKRLTFPDQALIG